MPVFGEYETFGEPISVTEERGHTSTVWQARLSGSKDGRTFAIKCYLPRPRRPKPGESEETLDKDRGLEFLEAIKQLKKTHTDGGRYLCPIHAFGIAPEGAWYVTDFYPGKTLKELIIRRGRVDSAALRHVIRSVVNGCLALKRSRGYSHGNLKAANVFLVGSPKALSKRPIELGDPYPASASQLSGLDEEDRRAVSDLLNQTVEAQDLRGLGELLLQLVRGRVIANAFDFDYPIARSPAWDNLGKDGETWRELTNQLLSPQLSLQTINLELMEKKFPPAIDAGKLRKLAMAAGGVLLVGGLLYGALAIRRSKAVASFREHVHLAEAAWVTTNLTTASNEINLALTFEPRDAAALGSAKDLKTKIQGRLEQYNAALDEARKQYKAGNAGTAATRLAEAKALYPGGDRILKEREYGEALTQALKDFQAQDWTNAISNANRVLVVERADEQALRIKSDAETKLASISQAALQQKQQQMNKAVADFDDSMGRAAAALDLTNSAVAKTKFEDAKRLARALQDAAREKEAEGGLALANQISEALVANKAGNVADEVSWLQQASADKHAPRMLALWLSDARQRQKLISDRKQAGEKLADLNTSLGKAMGFLEVTNSARAKTEFGTAKALAQELKDASKVKDAEDGLALADQLGNALTARDNGRVDEEVSWLQKATAAGKQPKMLALWLADAQQRAKTINEQKQAKQKLDDFTAALGKGRDLLEQTNSAAAKPEFQAAKKLAQDFKDAQKEKDADEGLVLAEQVRNALAAKSAGNADAEVTWLQQASTNKNQPKMLAGWRSNAQERQKATLDQKEARQKLDEFASSLGKGRGFLDRTNSMAAKPEFQAAKKLAQDLKDTDKEKEADEGLVLVNELNEALAANKLGNVDDEVSWLVKAAGRANHPKMLAGWLANAQQRQKTMSDQKEAKQKLIDFSTALGKGRGLLEQTNGAAAKPEFQTAKRLAQDLKDAQKEKDADEGLVLAERVRNAQAAKTAANVDDEVNWLQQASTNKNQPKMLAGWLRDAKERSALAADRASFGNALARGSAALTNAQFAAAETNFAAASVFASKLDKAAQTRAQSLKDFAGAFAGVLSMGKDQGVRAFDLASGALTKAAAAPAFPREALLIGTNIAAGIATNGCQAAIVEQDRDLATEWLGRAKNYSLLDAMSIAAMQKRIEVLPPPMRKELPAFHGITFVKVGRSPTTGKVFYASMHEITAGEFNEILNGAPPAPQDTVPAACDAQAAKDFCDKLNKLFLTERERLNLKGGAIKLPSQDEYLLMAQVSPDMMDKQFRVSPTAFAEIKRRGEVIGLGTQNVDFQPAVPGQCTNSLGLVNIIGNVPEWSEDGKILGLSYYGTGSGRGRALVTEARDQITGTFVGLRPILVVE